MTPRFSAPARKIAAFCLAAVLASCAVYVFYLPDVRQLKTSNPKTTAYIELRKKQAAKAGKKFTLRMKWTNIDDISPDLVNAVIVAEDGAFYRHKGVDWAQTQAAFKQDLKKRRFAAGASTITQQLARNLYLSPSKNPLRKLKELLIARQLEKRLGKRRILELYLNVAEWGKGVFGVGAASEVYFGKPASALGVEEAGALASVLPSPRRWNPLSHGTYSDRRAQSIIKRMKASGYLDDEEEDGDQPSVDEEVQPEVRAEEVSVSSMSVSTGPVPAQ